MTKAFLERQRAELKKGICQIHMISTAHRRARVVEAEKLLEHLREIESLAFSMIVQHAATDVRTE